MVNRMKARIRNDTWDRLRLLWELLDLIALNECAGFGNKRLKRYMTTQRHVQANFDRQACCTDKPHHKDAYTDLDTAVILTIRAAESRGIDWREILGKDIMI